MKSQELNALVFGSTGAIGAELINLLVQSSNWKKIHCVVRRQLEEWKSPSHNQKLVIERFDDMDEYFKQKNDHYSHINTVFCCLGSQVKFGEQTFRKIDKTYPLLAADIAINNKIPHYLLFSSKGGDQNSWFLYMRVKGEVERDMKLKHLKKLSIFKPGLLNHRRDARTGEKIIGCCPCVPQIEAIDSAKVLIRVAEKQALQHSKQQGDVQVYENADMLQVVAQIGI